ncbi:SRPBCC family protein [Nocardioides sp. YIM 152315]|uniref:SRPBCC family protein n=1 Tax=Nocardioides sp. YIM 152315 TaxID=3031760 RepID=UPI0023DB1BF2|nr:SRPBCC family protein [Nocardioides sp. YIM 152315]MDF1604829.1 SRPBCC family protein [Nocardioides sp. YIM 152315]
MTFEYEHSVTTTASPAEVWALWSDVGSWHCWDPAVERVALEGHFAEGAAGTMCLAGGVEAPFMLEIVEPHARYLDRLTIGDLTIRVDHQLSAVNGTTQVLVRTTIEGDGAHDIGSVVTGDTPKALEALVGLAEKKG